MHLTAKKRQETRFDFRLLKTSREEIERTRPQDLTMSQIYSIEEH